MQFMERLRAYTQSIPFSLGAWLASFTGIILVRALLEQYSSFKTGEYILMDIPAMLHGIVFYLISILGLMIILLYFGKTNLKEVALICLFGFFVVWVAPLIDLTLSGVGGHPMGYIFSEGKDLLLRFFTFFGESSGSGITFGIKVETIMGIIFSFTYVYSATKKIRKGVGAAIAFYCMIFFIVSIPSLIAFFLPTSSDAIVSIKNSLSSSHIVQNSLTPNFEATENGFLGMTFDKAMIGVNIILSIMASMILFYLGAKEKFIAVVKNSRPERIFHFFLLFIFGSSLVFTKWFGGWIDVLTYILALLAFTSAWLYSVCQNDIYDEPIDLISNPNRPIITSRLSKSDMEFASIIFLVFTFIPAYVSGLYTLFFVSLFLLIYYLYSNPPLRLKRFVMINSFFVSLACLAIIMSGFFIVSPEKIGTAFPFSLVIAIVIFFTTVSNIRDLKDVEGDKADGIKTLPVLLGLKKSQKLIAGTICFFFLFLPYYFHINFLVIPSIIASLLSWYFITEKNYKEWKGFAVYMIYLIIIISVFILK